MVPIGKGRRRVWFDGRHDDGGRESRRKCVAPAPRLVIALLLGLLLAPLAGAGEAAAAPAPPAGYAQSIVVSLSRQILWAYEGPTVVLRTAVSTGKPGFETPTGLFAINSKLESQTMAGVIGGESYNVPDVPWVMYFTDVGHALHGTYWHANFGVPMSHGCVNLPVDTAAWLYGWAPIGTPVQIVW